MLAVFERSVSRPPPELEIHSGWKVPGNRVEAAELFSASSSDPTFFSFSNGNFMALSRSREDPAHPRSIVALDDVFCIFAGNIENIVDLRRHYGLTRHTTETMLIVEAYKVLRDRAPYPPDQVIKDITGKFAFVLFDLKNGNLFAARDRDGGVKLHWGMIDDGSLAFSDDSEVMLDVCGRSRTHFPSGCIYQNSSGLASFVYPLHKVKAILSRDDDDEPCRVRFHVDLLTRLPSIPRVGSDSNWTEQTATIDATDQVESVTWSSSEIVASEMDAS